MISRPIKISSAIIVTIFTLFLTFKNYLLFSSSTVDSNLKNQNPKTIEQFNQKYFWGTFKPQYIHGISSRDTKTNNQITLGMMYYKDL